MCISGLSSNLCFVAAIVINFLVGSLLLRPAYTTTNHHDFSNSRQFKKNLAVSKYQNNTYWLPNYKWTPPEKVHGPRKKPAWEIMEHADSEVRKKEPNELKKWEEQMREVTRREREKWKVLESDAIRSSNNLQNGRWGMRAVNPASVDLTVGKRKTLDSNASDSSREK